jgi:isopenicillin N synthase-like dioxygenase
MSQSELPIIDLGAAIQGQDAERRRAAEEIRRACSDVGFFYIVNHGTPQATIDAAAQSMWGFFHLPLEAKRKVAVDSRHRGWHEIGGALMYGADRPDYKEFFGIGLELSASDKDVLAGQPLRGPNNWPDFAPQVRQDFYRYYQEVGVCGARLMRLVAVSLGLDEHFFAPRYVKPMQRTQAVYYPPQPPDLGPDQYGVAPHTDYGCITLLWQDEVGGLEVRRRDGEWIAAPPVAGSFVVNVGDLLARWSNDRFASTPHRVVNRSGVERLSIATFYDPSYDAAVDPVDLGLGGAAALYPPVAAGDYILGRINDSMSYRRALKASVPA